MALNTPGRGGGPTVVRNAHPRDPSGPARENGVQAKNGPFTLPHFRKWSRRLILDNGDPWVLEQFQESFIADFFAGRPENWAILPEGNAKTTLVAGIALYHIEHRQSAEAPIAASSREQAEILYRQAEGFVLRTPEIRNTFECLPGYREIRCATSGGRIKVFAGDQRTADGAIFTLAIVEEGHRHKDMGLYRTWRGKTSKRNGQILLISTAGEPFGEFETARDLMRQMAEDVQRTETFVRAVSAETLLHEWAVPEGGDTEDLELVKRANPLKAMTLAKLAEKRASPSYTKQHWDRLVCCRPTRADTAAIQEAEWERAESTERIPDGAPVWVGLDVGWRRDTTAIVPMWARGPKFRLLGPAKILVPPTDGTTLHPDVIKAAFLELRAQHPIQMVVMDEYHAVDVRSWIEGELGCPVIAHSQQDAQAAQDYEHFMTGLRNRELWHSGDPALTRHAMAASARTLTSQKTRFDRLTQARRGATHQRVQPNDALIAAAMVNSAFVDPPKSDQKPQWRLLS